YTNPLVHDKKMAYRYFADSNLNWGQRQVAVKKFLREHPSFIFEPASPVAGTIVVDINNLTGIKNTEQFRWLREQHIPVGTFEDCYLIYDIKDSPR
ncbi:MAG TPA: hypothetical protein VLD19_04245, partial [Chitinophagaceae bacterium]|nr:hypothetical protein [Chitinophagaceae bacterium]